MKIDRAAYTKTFPVGVYWEKIHLECSLDDTDDHIKAVLILKEEVERSHKLANPQLYKNGEALVESFGTVMVVDQKGNSILPTINRKYDEMKAVIGECADMEELKKHKDYVSRNPDLMSTYMNKLKELTPKTSYQDDRFFENENTL